MRLWLDRRSKLTLWFLVYDLALSLSGGPSLGERFAHVRDRSDLSPQETAPPSSSSTTTTSYGSRGTDGRKDDSTRSVFEKRLVALDKNRKHILLASPNPNLNVDPDSGSYSDTTIPNGGARSTLGTSGGFSGGSGGERIDNGKGSVTGTSSGDEGIRTREGKKDGE